MKAGIITSAKRTRPTTQRGLPAERALRDNRGVRLGLPSTRLPTLRLARETNE